MLRFARVFIYIFVTLAVQICSAQGGVPNRENMAAG